MMNANIMKVAVVVDDDKRRPHVDAVGVDANRVRHGDSVEGIDDDVGRRHDDADDGGDDNRWHNEGGGCRRRR